MNLFLHVLMYIGLALLYILLFIILLVLLVLFLPVFYNAKGSYKDEESPVIRARVHWLFGFFRLSYDFGDEDPLKIKILWFRLNKRKKPVEEINFDEPENDEDLSSEEKQKSDDSSKAGENVGSLANKSDGKEVNTSNDEAVAEKGKTSKKKKTSSQKTNIYDKIKAYTEILKSKRFKSAYRYSKDKIRKILKSVLPRKWDITCLIGFDDPSTTGSLIAVTSMLYPVIAKHIHVYGSFDKKLIDAKGYAKGHITVITLLINGLKIYFNKDIKKIIKLFKEV